MKWLITADWHLRDTKPRCRMDESFLDFQLATIRDIIRIATEHDVRGILVLGDMFDAGNQSLLLVNSVLLTMSKSPIPFYIFPGNHDLQNHTLKNMNLSAFGVFWNMAMALDTELIKPMHKAFSWEAFQGGITESENESKQILAVHRLIVPQDSTIPSSKLVYPADLLKEFPEYEAVIGGDYHHGHVFKGSSRLGGRTVIVPGCTIRMASDMVDYKPHVVIYDIQTKEIEQVPVLDASPDLRDLVGLDHIVQKEITTEIKENQFAAVTLAAQQGVADSLDFDLNVQTMLDEKPQEDLVVEEIRKAMGFGQRAVHGGPNG